MPVSDYEIVRWLDYKCTKGWSVWPSGFPGSNKWFAEGEDDTTRFQTMGTSATEARKNLARQMGYLVDQE
jgi:photosystem II stability/assembly factor-like uncharacterized protein